MSAQDLESIPVLTKEEVEPYLLRRRITEGSIIEIRKGGEVTYPAFQFVFPHSEKIRSVNLMLFRRGCAQHSGQLKWWFTPSSFLPTVDNNSSRRLKPIEILTSEPRDIDRVIQHLRVFQRVMCHDRYAVLEYVIGKY